ncbi:MAG: hypothetical protein MN733_18055 [Nitrososphaera sp.]|nr:hypothetical protein [Nitrososphaera sp.]
MSTKERAEQLRQAFKALGYNQRDVSVKCDYFSMGSAIDVTIRSVKVDIDKVRKLVSGAENIHRCEITGEILSGGNCYAHLHYSPQVREILAHRHIQAIADAYHKAKAAEPNTGELWPVNGFKDVYVGRGNWASEIVLWRDNRPRRYNDCPKVCEAMAFELATGE